MRTFRDIIDSRDEIDDDNPETIDLDGPYHLEISRSRVALIRMVSKPTKEDPSAVVPRLVADYVMWYPEVTDRATVGRDGKITRTRNSLFYPEVIRGARRYTLAFPVTDLKSVYSLPSLIPLFHRAGLKLPLDGMDRAVMGNLLSNLGVDDESRYSGIEPEAMGWGKVDGRWTYMAPAGSVDTEGIVDVRVSAPGAEGEEDALPEALGRIGFNRVAEDEELVEDADAIAAFIATCRDEHPLPYLLLGTLFAAPLPQPEQTTVNVVGGTGSGKSHVAKTLMLFLSSSLDPTADLTGKPTLPGLQGRAVWSRHAPCLWDDYRVSDAREDPDLRKNANSLIQMHQSGVDAAKSNKERGVARSRLVRSWGILTSEETLGGGSGILNRTLVTKVTEGDINLTPMGDAPLDHFRRDFGAQTGRARAFYAAYLRWLAEQITDAGSLSAFEAEVTRLRNRTVEKLHTSRTTASAAKLLVGWTFLREFARENGFEGKLPDTHTVERMILAGANEADEAAVEANEMVRILERVREKVASGAAHVAAEDNGAPSDWDYLGWRQEVGFEPRPISPTQAGKIAGDEWVCVNSDILRRIAKEEGIGTGWRALLDMTAKLPHVHPESRAPGDAKPNVEGFRTRPRGVYLRTAWLVPGWTERNEDRSAPKRVPRHH